jgi:hypothetical protein
MIAGTSVIQPVHSAAIVAGGEGRGEGGELGVGIALGQGACRIEEDRNCPRPFDRIGPLTPPLSPKPLADKRIRVVATQTRVVRGRGCRDVVVPPYVV